MRVQDPLFPSIEIPRCRVGVITRNVLVGVDKHWMLGGGRVGCISGCQNLCSNAASVMHAVAMGMDPRAGRKELGCCEP